MGKRREGRPCRRGSPRSQSPSPSYSSANSADSLNYDVLRRLRKVEKLISAKSKRKSRVQSRSRSRLSRKEGSRRKSRSPSMSDSASSTSSDDDSEGPRFSPQASSIFPSGSVCNASLQDGPGGRRDECIISKGRSACNTPNSPGNPVVDGRNECIVPSRQSVCNAPSSAVLDANATTMTEVVPDESALQKSADAQPGGNSADHDVDPQHELVFAKGERRGRTEAYRLHVAGHFQVFKPAAPDFSCRGIEVLQRATTPITLSERRDTKGSSEIEESPLAAQAVEELKERSATPALERAYPGGGSLIRQAFLMKHVSEKAADTLIQSLSTSTLKQYEVTFKSWWKYCQDHNVNPLHAQVEEVISFLQYLMETTNYGYGTFNAHRSALSLILPGVGSNFLVKRFLKAVFNLRPSKPRYENVWDPNIVLKFLDVPTPPSDLKKLSYKLATLLLLATGQRIQTISLIRLSNIKTTSKGVTIPITERVETSRPGCNQPCLHLKLFTEKPNLCVATLIMKYLEVTRPFRESSMDDKLFLCHQKPHRPAKRPTISRWVKETLKEAGVDTSIFSAYSTRHAATSDAYRKGVSIDTIRSSAGWSPESSVFARFYNRPLTESPDEFTNRVFQLDPN
ncbi:unnamed protein product [Nesidiocoris tenuis]|uniref:Tyr recombinase domain-containing protein n=2 Tax=Nesidiocoris tenuis TaxID=355587 RepID=A0A6H5GJA7_9HEMI|nr:unnamed protein product [Nesidiocoris tenuis]